MIERIIDKEPEIISADSNFDFITEPEINEVFSEPQDNVTDDPPKPPENQDSGDNQI